MRHPLFEGVAPARIAARAAALGLEWQAVRPDIFGECEYYMDPPAWLEGWQPKTRSGWQLVATDIDQHGPIAYAVCPAYKLEELTAR